MDNKQNAVSNAQVEQAAEAAGDPERLLPEENPQTTEPEEARRWISTYTELIGFKEKLLASAHKKIPELTEEDALREAVDTDLVLLEAENERLRRRLDFWQRRKLALKA
jgi:hypothetical protein